MVSASSDKIEMLSVILRSSVSVSASSDKIAMMVCCSTLPTVTVCIAAGYRLMAASTAVLQFSGPTHAAVAQLAFDTIPISKILYRNLMKDSLANYISASWIVSFILKSQYN